MKINGVELNLDIYDPDVLEKCQNEFENVIKESKKGSQVSSPSEAIRSQCNIIKNCFDNLFEEGTAQKIFGDKTNLLDCLNAFENLANEVNKQMNKISKYKSKKLNKKK